MYEKYVEKWSGRQYMNKIKEKNCFHLIMVIEFLLNCSIKE